MNYSDKKTILIVDDMELNREILRLILKENYNTLEASNGLEAKNVLEKEAFRISLILLDIVMPVMDGFALLKYIQRKEEYKNIPVILVTAEAYEENVLKGVKLGIKDVIAKPYDPYLISNRIDNLITLSESHANENGDPFDLSFLYAQEEKKIPDTALIIDDEEINRVILRGALEESYKTIEASNGEEALELIRAYEDVIAVVLLDIIMPVMDGIELMEQVKQNHLLENTPILAITAEDSLPRIQKIKELGICDVIPKPFNPYIVMNRVDQMIQLYSK